MLVRNVPKRKQADTRKLNKVKKKRVEGWDMKLLARSIEACAVSLGVLQVAHSLPYSLAACLTGWVAD